MASKTGKARAFAFLIYEDSWPTWETDLKGLHMPAVVSPVHDRDVYEEDDKDLGHIAGEVKKAHRHAILSWGNTTTYKNALATLEPFGVTHVEPVTSYSGYCRYLAHLDDPDKAQYDPADIVTFGGAVPDLSRKLNSAEVADMRNQILEFIRAAQVTEYADLVYHTLDNGLFEWTNYVETHTVFLQGVLSSVRHSLAMGELERRNAEINASDTDALDAHGITEEEEEV